MRTFYLNRKQDRSGVSGTGRVAEGVVFSNGWVALTWMTGSTSLCFYESLDAVELIHGHSGDTDVVFE